MQWIYIIKRGKHTMKYLNAFLIKVSKNIQIIKGGVLQLWL